MPVIRFYANMRTMAGLDSLNIDDGNTLGDVLAELVRRFPVLQLQFFEHSGNLRQDVPIFVNGRNPRLAGMGIDIKLEPDDEISLFSPISSGRLNVEVLRPLTSGKQGQTR